MQMDVLAEYGYIGLFIASFLAATILPFSSEVVLVFLLLNNHDPFLSITVATAGNVLGSVVNYALGFRGSKPKYLLTKEEIYEILNSI